MVTGRAVSTPPPPDTVPPRTQEHLVRAMREAVYEVLPFKSTEEQVLAHVSTGTPLTVTTTEAKGLDRTLEVASDLARHGYRVAPHLAGRLVRDRVHLADIVAQLQEVGISDVFAVAGDAAEPVGEFRDSVELLDALDALGRPFSSVGVGGYPEGHGHIGSDDVEKALLAKAPRASHMSTQLCFDPKTTVDWARRVQAAGVDLPIKVGIPGAVSRQKLIRISASLGLGQSARFLKKQQGMLWRFFLPGGYSPDKLIKGLAPALGRTDTRLAGFHVFTFNELANTEAWRQAWLRRLS